MQDENNIPNEDFEQTTAKQWLQDNFRIIVSILIVVAIAGGIYSYSKRSEETTATKEVAVEENAALNNETAASDKTAETAAPEKKAAKEIAQASSQETEGAFIETAGAKDGKTVLARRALANYLEKNQDSDLSPEHKIYIEDYLRKNVSQAGSVRIGTSVEFSKDLIQKSIAKSKTLNEKQLKNLHKYAVRVPSLS